MAQVLINGGVLSLFIIALGGSNFAVGTAFTMNFFAGIARPLAVPRVDSTDRKRMVLIWFSIAAVCFAGMFLAHPVMLIWGPEVAVWYIVGVFLAERICMNIGAAAWTPLLGDIIPSSLWGRFFGRMRFNFQIISLFLIVLIGWYLGTSPEAIKFYPVFLILFIGSIVRPLLLFRLPGKQSIREEPAESILKNFSRPFYDRNFRKFLLFWAGVAITVNMARPFAVPFLKQNLDFPSSITAYASGGLLLGTVVVLLPWGRLADKFGNKFVFLLSILIIIVSFNFLAWTPVYEEGSLLTMAYGIAAFFLTGVSLGGLGIAHTVRTMHEAPTAHRGAYVAVFFTINGLAAGLSTTFVGAFLDQLPLQVEMFGRELDPMRIFFPATSLLVLSTLFLLARLRPVAELPVRDTLVNFVSLLTPSLTMPLRLIKMDPHSDDKL